MLCSKRPRSASRLLAWCRPWLARLRLDRHPSRWPPPSGQSQSSTPARRCDQMICNDIENDFVLSGA